MKKFLIVLCEFFVGLIVCCVIGASFSIAFWIDEAYVVLSGILTMVLAGVLVYGLTFLIDYARKLGIPAAVSVAIYVLPSTILGVGMYYAVTRVLSLDPDLYPQALALSNSVVISAVVILVTFIIGKLMTNAIDLLKGVVWDDVDEDEDSDDDSEV